MHSAETQEQPAPRVSWQVATALLLVFGVQVWLIVGRGNWGTQRQLYLMGAAIVLALIPPVAQRVAAGLDRLRRPTHRAIWLIALAIFLISIGYLYFTAHRQGRTFGFTSHDEHGYAIQAQMLARGRLWMPEHPAADSFDSFYLIVRPVYASMYFSGAAIFWTPMVWLGLPWWVMPLVLSGLAVAGTYLVVTELLDGVAGLLAAMLMVSLDEFRIVSLMLYAQVPVLVLGLGMILAWLRWRRSQRIGWALLLGTLTGWALITRPLDSLIFALPVGLAMVLSTSHRSQLWKTGVALAAGVLPFAILQLIANKGITGSWLTTPHAMYTRAQFPGVKMGFARAPREPVVQSHVPQKRQAYDDWVANVIKEHEPRNLLDTFVNKRLPMALAQTVPNPLLAILVPLGWAAGIAQRRWVIVAGFPLLMLLYLLYPFFLRHYPIVVAPAMIAAVLLGAWQVERTWPRFRSFARTAMVGVILAASVGALPEVNRYAHDELTVTETAPVQRIVASLKTPALLLFQWTPQASWAEEPVYNVDVAWPDDAPVVRAHWLSDELNRRLIEHYATHQPDRRVYVVRRPVQDDSQPVYLGTAGELAGRTLTLSADGYNLP